ncbi:MAG: hypothetical protein ACKOCK_06095 [Chloroflexota bacterium]
MSAIPAEGDPDEISREIALAGEPFLAESGCAEVAHGFTPALTCGISVGGAAEWARDNEHGLTVGGDEFSSCDGKLRHGDLSDTHVNVAWV